MKKVISIVSAAALLLIPGFASAHQTQQLRIDGELYQFVVGSLNEPVTVDDKTGVYLQVTEVDHTAGTDHHSTAGAVTGLEETLQVEISAGKEKKVLSLAPIHGEVGAYRAPFYPTVATTYNYRFFGTINNTPVDLMFTCNVAGHATAEEETDEVEISNGVTRVSKTGSFGCPTPKESLGFPEETSSLESLSQDVGTAKGTGMAGLALGVIALLVGGYAARRKN
jgi:hypothetical protein